MRVEYVSGSRADFGLMSRALQTLARADGIDLGVTLTGQALSPRYGAVEREVTTAGLRIAARIPAQLSGADGREMALALADELRGLTLHWAAERPELVLVLGDRGEMLAAAIAAFHLEIPLAHIHGGERSGTLDEGFRHAISKLATYHFVATEDSRERLVAMGEWRETIWVIGAPGLVDIRDAAPADPAWLRACFGLPAGGPAALMMFHPVVQERDEAFQQTEALLAALVRTGARAVILRPNSDAGGAEIDRCLGGLHGSAGFVVLDHLPRPEYLRALAAADLLIGNSSSGIIESASVGTPCVNVGTRQEGRLRNDNTIDCPEFGAPALDAAIAAALALRGPFTNRYGNGRADERLLAAVRDLPPLARAPKKRNAY